MSKSPGFTILDRDESFAADPQSIWMQTDIDAVLSGVYNTGVRSGCQVTAQVAPDMTVAVAAGVMVSGGTKQAVAGGNVTIGAADPDDPRIDCIVADSAGVKQNRAGTAAAHPKAPEVSAGDVLLAMVLVPAGAGSIVTSYITDKRVFLPDHNSLTNLDTGDPHTLYALLGGRAGGQTIIGGTGASENLLLQSTTHGTRGYVESVDNFLVSGRMGLNTIESDVALHVAGHINAGIGAFGIYAGAPMLLEPAAGETSATMYISGTIVAGTGLTIGETSVIHVGPAGRSGVGTIPTAYGIYIETPGIGATSNIGLFIGPGGGAYFGLEVDAPVLFGNYVRVGSLTAPTNVTAGDLTIARMSIGNVVFVDYEVVNVAVSQAVNEAVYGAFISISNTPTASGGYELVPLWVQGHYRGAFNNSTVVVGGKFELDVWGTGKPAFTSGIDIIGLVMRGGAGAAMAVGSARSLAMMMFASVSGRAGAETVTIDSLLGVEIENGYAGFIAGDVVTVAYGVYVHNLGNSHVVNAYAFYSELVTGAATLNIGVKLDGATTAALWLNTDTAANGLIAWGTARDTVLQRLAADSLGLGVGDSLTLDKAQYLSALILKNTAGAAGDRSPNLEFRSKSAISCYIRGEDDRMLFIDTAGNSALGLYATYLGVLGAMRVGSLTAPSNVTAGDLTAVRLFLGSDQSVDLYSPAADVLKTDDAFQVLGHVAVGSAASINAYRALYLNEAFAIAGTTVTYGAYLRATNSGAGTGALDGVYIYVEHTGASARTVTGLYGTAQTSAGASGSSVEGLHFYAIANAGAFDVMAVTGLYLLVQSATQSGLITTAYGLRITGSWAGSKPTTAYGIYVDASILPSGVGTAYGLYIGDILGGSTLGVGVHVGASPTAALWLNTNVPASGAILWGATRDTNLYRGAADVLYSDDSLRLAGHLCVGSTSAPTNVTAGDLTALRMMLGTQEALGVSVLLDLNSVTGALLLSRMTTAQKTALTPVSGMVLYDATLNQFFGYHTAWQRFIMVGTPADYTTSNVTTDRTYDADLTSLDELADVLGTLIVDLQSYGLLQ